MIQALREARVRRALRRHGILLLRNGPWSMFGDHFGGYTLIDVHHNALVAGVRFGWTLDDCEEWLRGE